MLKKNKQSKRWLIIWLVASESPQRAKRNNGFILDVRSLPVRHNLQALPCNIKLQWQLQIWDSSGSKNNLKTTGTMFYLLTFTIQVSTLSLALLFVSGMSCFLLLLRWPSSVSPSFELTNQRQALAKHRTNLSSFHQHCTNHTKKRILRHFKSIRDM